MRNPLQLPIDLEFTPWQDWTCFLGAMFLLSLPITAVAIIVAVLLSFR